MRGFTNWQRLTKESVEQHAPDGLAALQVKRVGGLVNYPSGKSAMLWYGYASENAGATLTEHFEDELRQPGTRGYGTLRFRYIPGGQQARDLDVLTLIGPTSPSSSGVSGNSSSKAQASPTYLH